MEPLWCSAIFVRSGKVEMISTFKRNQHFRKLLVNKTFMHVQEQKKRCRRDIPLIFRLVKNRRYVEKTETQAKNSFFNFLFDYI